MVKVLNGAARAKTVFWSPEASFSMEGFEFDKYKLLFAVSKFWSKLFLLQNVLQQKRNEYTPGCQTMFSSLLVSDVSETPPVKSQ